MTSKNPVDWIGLDRQYLKYQKSIDNEIGSVLRSGQYILGEPVKRLEDTLAAYAGSAHAVACGSGTDALLLALLALNLPPESEIITSPFSFVSTAEVILRAGAVPVFSDIDPETYNLDPKKLNAAITLNTKAIMPVSLFGLCAELGEINSIAKKHDLPVIEDGSQSFGAPYSKSGHSCGVSTLGCTSFFPTKVLGCYGDGGMIFTNNASLDGRLRSLRTHGINSRGECEELGMNSRLDALQAAVLLGKWPYFEEEIQARRQAARYYVQHLSHIPGIRLPQSNQVETHIFAQFTIETGARDALKKFLWEKNIPTAIYYAQPLHLQKAFSAQNYGLGAFPQAEKAAQRVLSLPLHPFISEEELETVFEAIMEFMG